MSCHIFGVNLLRRNSWETLGRLEEHTDYKFLSLCHYNLKKKKNRNCSAIFWSMVMVLTLKYHSAHSWSHEGPQIVLGVLKIVVSGVSPFFFFCLTMFHVLLEHDPLLSTLYSCSCFRSTCFQQFIENQLQALYFLPYTLAKKWKLWNCEGKNGLILDKRNNIKITSKQYGMPWNHKFTCQHVEYELILNVFFHSSKWFLVKRHSLKMPVLAK